MRSIIFAVGAATALGGCLSNPATGVASNGHPLKLKFESGTGSYVSNDVTSEDTVVDANGNEAGTIQHRQDVTHSYQWSQWSYLQGREKLDEQDFYRLSGDQAAADEVARQRSKAELEQKLGLPLAIIGYIGSALLISYGSQHQDAVMENLGIYGGGAVGAAGTLLYTAGYLQLKNPHLLPQDRAEQNADLLETCREGARCRVDRGGRTHRLEESEVRQLRVPFQRVSLGMR
jgi:hypothetical protein